MKRLAALGAGLFFLGGCALPVPVQIASWVLDGISYLMTEKSVTDHGLSVLAQKDCAVLRGLMDPGEFCRDFDDGATDLADGMPYENLFTEDKILSAEADAEATAFAEFETAGGGDVSVPVTTDTTELMIDTAGHMPEMGALTNARPTLEDSVEAAASLVSAAWILEGRISLDAFPHQIVVHATTLEEILQSQQAMLGDVEDLGPYVSGDVAVAQVWTVRTTRIVETGLEPAAGYYFVIGSFRDHANAQKLRNQYRGLTPSVLAARLDDITLYRVVVGPFVKNDEQIIKKNIFRAGIADSWAIQVKPGDWRMALIDPPATVLVEVAVARPAQELREWNAMGYTQMLSKLVY